MTKVELWDKVQNNLKQYPQPNELQQKCIDELLTWTADAICIEGMCLFPSCVYERGIELHPASDCDDSECCERALLISWAMRDIVTELSLAINLQQDDKLERGLELEDMLTQARMHWASAMSAIVHGFFVDEWEKMYTLDAYTNFSHHILKTTVNWQAMTRLTVAGPSGVVFGDTLDAKLAEGTEPFTTENWPTTFRTIFA